LKIGPHLPYYYQTLTGIFFETQCSNCDIVPIWHVLLNEGSFTTEEPVSIGN